MLSFTMTLFSGSITKRTHSTALRRSRRLQTRTTNTKSSAPVPPTTASVNIPTTPTEHAASLYVALQDGANQQRAEQMSGYMRGKFPFFGVFAPERRRLTKSGIDAVLNSSVTTPEFALDVCAALWTYDEREAQYVGMDVLDRCASHWPHAPANVVLNHLEIFMQTRPWWDTIDMLASHSVRDAHRGHPGPLYEAVERWVVSEHMWTRRTAIIWQLKRKKDTDVEMLFRFIEMNKSDEDWFIRKAIGWALRQYRRTDSKVVDEYVERNIDSLSKLSIREAWKHK